MTCADNRHSAEYFGIEPAKLLKMKKQFESLALDKFKPVKLEHVAIVQGGGDTDGRTYVVRQESVNTHPPDRNL